MRVEVQELTLSGDEELSHLRPPLSFPNNILPSPLDWKVFTLVRVKPTWIQGEVHTSLSEHPSLASSLLLFKSPSKWDETIALYPAGSLGVNADLVINAKKREVHANIRSTRPGGKGKAVVVCVRASGAVEERSVVKRAVDEARTLLGGRPHEGGGNEFWDELGVCTWESFRQGEERTRPSKDMLLGLVPDLPIKSFLIDDGWQDTRRIRPSATSGEKGVLYSFGAWDGMGAPMQEVVASLKEKGVEEVGVWLTLQGYWCGIHPASPLIDKYDCQAYPTAALDQPRGGVKVPLQKGDWEQWLPSLDKASKFWEDWFTEMKSWGIGFLKVDNQAHYDAIVGPNAAAIHQAMWAGMLAAFDKVWDGDMSRLIMCMSHNERMVNGSGGLDFARPSGNLVFRNSDDFNISFSNKHTHFIHWNLHMSILTSHLSLVQDYDMFSTNPEDRWPLYNALLRCLSPGPILLSDAHGVGSDRALLDRMTAKDITGRVKVVRTQSGATALANRWFWDNLQGSRDGPALVGGVPLPIASGALLGVWNGRDADSDARAIDSIGFQDVGDVLGTGSGEQGQYALYTLGLSKENGQKVSLIDPSTAQGSGMPMELELNPGECELVIVAKVWHLSGKKVALVGMLDKLAPLAGVEVVGVEHDELVVRVTYETEQLSVLVFAEESVPVDSLRVSVDGQSKRLNGGKHTSLPLGASLHSVAVGSSAGQLSGRVGAYEVRWKII